MASNSNLYNHIPYVTRPERRSHPWQLATCARLHGLAPHAVANARILELGCGDGGNALSIAALLPGSYVVGVDIAEQPLQRARNLAAITNVANISFVQASVAAFSSQVPFDYVIAHGLASWVAPAVRHALFRCIFETLQPDGVGFISFNVLPGWHIRLTMREACLAYAGGSGPVHARASRAREILTLLKDHLQTGDYLPPDTLRAEAEFLLNLPDWYLVHDLLAEENHPLSFTQFQDELDAAGFYYVGDASTDKGHRSMLPEPVRQAFQQQLAGAAELEIMADHFTQRMFRCAVVSRKPPTEMLRTTELLLGARASYTSRYEVSALDPFELIGPGGRILRCSSSLQRAVVVMLAQRWPRWIDVAELVATLMANDRQLVMENVQSELREVLADGIEKGSVDILLEPAPLISSMLAPAPFGWLYARQQAHRGAIVTNLRHEWVELRPEERRVFCRLDGQTTLEEIGEELELTTRDVQAIAVQLLGYGLLTVS